MAHSHDYVADLMAPLSFSDLMVWARTELAQDGSIFGVDRGHFWQPTARRVIDAFGNPLAVPVGPAAGPQTQLANNLLVAFLTGGRFMELKTVQIMDGEQIRQAVSKPCIEMTDEGYNCEWSTELTVQEAFDEYVKAYFAIAVFAKELGLGTIEDVAFNLSVGYDLAGISSEKIDRYIEGMKDASGTPIWAGCRAWTETHLDTFTHFTRDDLDALGPQLSNSATLSTLHGCPADEIERIAHYLLTEKNFNTFVKCNPTMLGYDYARAALDRLGFDYVQFDDHHFTTDLQYGDAVLMLRRLTDVARQRGLRFGVKLTNTFPVQVAAGELPAEEMYMSGRSLYVLSLSLAAQLSREFEGTLPISFSGGIDAFNLQDVLATGIQPVTVASTLLKPGGVLRFNQLAALATEVMTDYRGIDVALLNRCVDDVFGTDRFHKRYREKIRSRKTASPLPLFDCFKAPCEHGGCPIEQQVPEYLALTAEGRFREAFDVIALDNTAPTVTGVLCSEQCREHCTRLDYDISIDMRGVKLVASDNAQDAFIEQIAPPPLATDQKVAIIGAGPAGLASAIFLRRNGMDVEVFEKLDGPYGIVKYIIPKFRISREQIERDFRLATALGVTIHFNCDPNYDVAELRKQYSHVIVATGSWGRGVNPLREGQENIVDALDFLWKTQNEEGQHSFGTRVAVIGAGDVAMDCLRTASRLPEVEVAELVYRRTEPFMPATQHEVNTVRAEGLTVHELLAPMTYDGGILTCEEMMLGEVDASGRRSVKGTGRTVQLQYDTVVGATGATVQTEAYTRNGIALDTRGWAGLDRSCQSSVPGVFVVGDGRRGPATVVEAIADAKVACNAILDSVGVLTDYARPHPTVHAEAAAIRPRRGLLIAEINGRAEGGRCLTCQDICEVCVEVCPNRANVAITVPGFSDPRQIIHIDGLCNECGTCGTFCPHKDRPYRDKLTVFWDRKAFDASSNTGLLRTAERTYLVRLPGGDVVEHSPTYDFLTADKMPPGMDRVIDALEGRYSYLLSPTLTSSE